MQKRWLFYSHVLPETTTHFFFSPGKKKILLRRLWCHAPFGAIDGASPRGLFKGTLGWRWGLSINLLTVLGPLILAPSGEEEMQSPLANR